MDEPQDPRRRVARRSAGPPVAAEAFVDLPGPQRATTGGPGVSPNDGPTDPGRARELPIGVGVGGESTTDRPPVPGPQPERRHRQRTRPDRSLSGETEIADPVGAAADAAETPTPAAPLRSRSEHTSERSLRSLVSTRSTQVSPTIAMRAREVAVPTSADLAEAERELVIVHRHYTPPTPLTAGRKRPAEPPRRRRGDAH